MPQLRPEDKRMCETSEKGERLFSDDEILPVNLEIGRRLMEVFGNQEISNITFRLKSTAREINNILDGRELPSCKLLLGIRKLTGVSVDWLLTGEGPKFGADKDLRDIRRDLEEPGVEHLPIAVIPIGYSAGRTTNGRISLQK